MVFQEANLLPWRNLRQNLEFPFEVKHRKPDEARIASLLHETVSPDSRSRSRVSSPAACSSAHRSCARSRRIRECC
jgi:ABC-type proline/glycine betaine transport system ATPase subunit